MQQVAYRLCHGSAPCRLQHAVPWKLRTSPAPRICTSLLVPHADTEAGPLQVRGLVTYCGPGTLFLDDQDVDRPGSGFMRFFGEDKQGHAVRRHGAVLQADAGDILLLKGRDYPGNEGGVICTLEAAWSAACLLQHWHVLEIYHMPVAACLHALSQNLLAVTMRACPRYGYKDATH